MLERVLHRFARPEPAPAGVRLQRLLQDLDTHAAECRSAADLLSSLDAAKYPMADCFRKHFDSDLVALAVALKTLNLFLARYHFQARSSRVYSRPFGLILDPSNACNLACPGCVHSTRAKGFELFRWNKNMLPDDRLGRFLTRYGPYAMHINFCNYGEPLINPETPRFIRQAKSYLMQTMLSTNMSVGRFDAEAYVASGLDYMLVSVDGATQPVYERYRKNGLLSVIFRNIENLVEAKQRAGSLTPVIAWRFITFEHNVAEIPQAIDLARNLGCDQFLTLDPYDVSWDDPAVRAAQHPPVNLLFHPEAEGAILGNWNRFPDSLDAETIRREFETPWTSRAAGHALEAAAPDSPVCHWLYRSITLDAGGRLLPCCAAPRPDIDLEFGDFEAEPDPYNSEKFRLARLSFADMPEFQRRRAATGLKPHCSDCEWNKETPNTGGTQIRQFLRGFGPDLFRPESLQILAGW
jgi:MoaA/NifB/PqqE/SkfB family radical SAM enzyme